MPYRKEAEKFCIKTGESSLEKNKRKISISPGMHEMYALGYAYFIFLSLTVVGRKNRCIPCVYWAAAIFVVVLNYSNLFLPFAFFLDCSHFTFGYELVVCPETAGFMKSIRDLFTSIQWDEPLLLYPGKIHRF